MALSAAQSISFGNVCTWRENMFNTCTFLTIPECALRHSQPLQHCHAACHTPGTPSAISSLHTGPAESLHTIIDETCQWATNCKNLCEALSSICLKKRWSDNSPLADSSFQSTFPFLSIPGGIIQLKKSGWLSEVKKKKKKHLFKRNPQSKWGTDFKSSRKH